MHTFITCAHGDKYICVLLDEEHVRHVPGSYSIISVLRTEITLFNLYFLAIVNSPHSPHSPHLVHLYSSQSANLHHPN